MIGSGCCGVFSGKWQATWCPGTSSASGGSCVRQICCAFQHLVWKRHAGGGASGLGTSPSNLIRSRRSRWPVGLLSGSAGAAEYRDRLERDLARSRPAAFADVLL